MGENWVGVNETFFLLPLWEKVPEGRMRGDAVFR
jgi:hypothetical protein